MSIINNGLLLAAGADAATTYQISRSIRLNSADSAYLSRTPGSAGSRTTWTWSAWIKRSKLGAAQEIWGAYTGTGNDEGLFYATFESDDKLYIYGWSSTFRKTTQVFRDVSAWYHIVIVADVTNGTANNRLRIYVNGSEVTTFDTITNPASTSQFAINSASAHYIGADPYSPSSRKGDYMLADVYLLDGTATTPSTFAETDAITGQWVPKSPTGISYGTNGFRLSFSDNSGTTSSTLGKDAAGSNNWTPYNFSVASGSGNDSLTDSPTGYGTDTGAGGEVRGNYCTLNAIDDKKGAAPTNGNLELAGTASCKGTWGLSTGKWYFEFVVTSISGTPMIGIATEDTKGDLSAGSAFFLYRGSDGQKQTTSGASSYGASYTSGDVIGIAFNADTSQVTFYKNNTSQGAISVTSGNTYFPMVVQSTGGTYTFNFGQRPFSYTAPANFKALCSTNLPTPTIALPNTVMDVLLWTGNGSARSITGLGFNPDLVWIKGRSGATDHALYDVVRGVEKRLESNNTDAEVTSDGGVTAFNSDGFSLGTLAQVNTNSATYAGWCFDAGSSTVTNNSGSISSQVRANASAGCSVVTYTGTGSNATVGHGCGAAPAMILVKSRSAANGWAVYHVGIGNTYELILNSTSAVSGPNGTYWNSTSPTSTVFSLGTDSWGNANGGTYVAYCFAPVSSYSSFGSYVGNGSSDGPFVFCNFRPRWVMIKRTDSTANWRILDTARDTYNIASAELYPSLSNAEGSFNALDINSNGFKIRNTDASYNASGGTYIYACFAESPFAYARAR